MWLQLYGYDDAVREPTPDEQRAMTYSSFIQGTRLMCYWQYKPMNALLWSSMLSLRQELARLEPIVFADRARCLRIGVRRGRVHYALWSDAHRSYLIACNVSPGSVLARLPLTANGERLSVERAWYETGSYRALGSDLWTWFPPFARQVWELS
jgi:hypothetical protein